MNQVNNQQKSCEARQIITDNELRHLTDKYHHRHPTFSVDIKERTCKAIILSCIYHYRHIQIHLNCQCVYNDDLHKFQSHWSSDDNQYKKVLDNIFIHLNSLSNQQSLDHQIQLIIEEITKCFVQLKSIKEVEEPKQQEQTYSFSPIEIIKYSESPLSRRRQNSMHRSFSWLKSFTSSSLIQDRAH